MDPPVRIVEDEYILYFHYWTRSTGEAINRKHEFSINSENHERLEGYRAAKESSVVDVDLDAADVKVKFNLLMNASQSKALLGV
jgi:hypothetical protein